MASRNLATLGTKLGPRIAMLVSQSIVFTHHKLHALKHRLAMAVFHSISDEISDEVDVTLGPFLRLMHESTPEDHPAYPAVKFMHEATGQLKAIAGTGLQMSGLLGAFTAVVNNELADIVYNVIRANPSLLPDPSTIAQSYAVGLVNQAEAEAGIGAQGIQYGWAQRILQLAVTHPDPSLSIELVRRSLIDRDTFINNAMWAGYTPADAARMFSLVGTPLSPADLALAVLRGNMDQATAEPQAFESGTSPDQFKVLLDNTGEPPGLQELLEAFRRKFISQADLERGIRQSRYRNEWIPMLEKLRYSPMSVADAVNAVVQNQMDAATASGIADQNGLEPGAFDILVKTAGEPLSRTEMEELFNRGLVSKDQVVQALRESRLKNKYNDLAFELHSRLLPITTLGTALRTGAISHDSAVQKAMLLGYSQEDATIYVNATSQAKLLSSKDKVVSSVAALYQDNIMGLADATRMIQGLGYSAAEAQFVLQASEFHREAHTMTTVINAIKAKYLQHHVTRQEATGLIDSTGLPSQQRDQLLGLWDIEYSAYTRELTPAQVLKALKLDLLTQAQALSRLEAMGYNEVDANLLISGA